MLRSATLRNTAKLLKTSPAKSYEEVQKSLLTCLNDHDLLPYVIGGNTIQLKNHLFKIRDEVCFLRDKRAASRQHTSKKHHKEHHKEHHKDHHKEHHKEHHKRHRKSKSTTGTGDVLG
ncbi:hypothetical protein PCANC_14531 [Puccinia coronata f. sp. avenae]|uniref:Uncharacterized protein n=1 Tax=Puccinia coronata f. sp. avenae TaxID=200324 RepID=A0A2N5SQR8_9BASI|nr:hypothetical protein PCANC_14531 [Puccinia coronata f. sp. avenae]